MNLVDFAVQALSEAKFYGDMMSEMLIWQDVQVEARADYPAVRNEILGRLKHAQR